MPTLSLVINLSSTDAVSSAQSISASDALAVEAPINGLSRVSVSNSAATTLVASSVSDDIYMYLKNTDATNFVELKDDAGNAWGKLGPGESTFFCVLGSSGFEMQADTAACVVEYAYWTKS